MITYKLKLGTQEDARKLNEIVACHTTEADLRQDHIKVNARSLLGILSMDFNKPLFLDVYDGCRRLNEHLQDYIVE